MTNKMIILMESVKLMEEGKIKGTGEIIVVEDAEGNKKQLEMPEAIHTYQHWKSMGYQVKKGEKAVSQFPIWKYTSKKAKDETEEEAQEKGYCFMKLSSFFTQEQVQEVEE